MEKIVTDRAPEAIGHYEQGYVAGGMVYTSMQIPLIPNAEQPDEMTWQEQALQALKNAAGVIEGAGGKLQDIVQVRIYLTEMDKFPIVNQVYESFMGAHKPARAVVGVTSLPKGFHVAVEAVAVENSEEE